MDGQTTGDASTKGVRVDESELEYRERLEAEWYVFPLENQAQPLRLPLRQTVCGLLQRACVAGSLACLNTLTARYWPSSLPVELGRLLDAMDAVLSGPSRCCPGRRTRRPPGPRTADP